MAAAATGAAQEYGSLDDFMFYQVPEELVAQTPAVPAESARLMVLRKSAGTIEHRYVRDLPEILDSSYVVLVNNTKVVDCKLVGRWAQSAEDITSTGHTKSLDELQEQVFYVMAKLPEKFVAEESGAAVGDLFQVSGEGLDAMPPNSKVLVGSGGAVRTGTLLRQVTDGSCDAIMGFDCSEEELKPNYRVPLPPYINQPESKDYEDRYQTIFAKESEDRSLGLGAVAAPTAGLHFTHEIKRALLEEKGVEILETTLHVGYGTFAHVHVKDLVQHRMHSEVFHMSEEVASKLQAAKNGDADNTPKKILTVGTTSTRTLETVARKRVVEEGGSCQQELRVEAGRGATDIFIRPGYEWQATDALLTNLHMPGLTPIMLVAAFAGYDLTKRAYIEALDLRYRFFSFGDAMLILP